MSAHDDRREILAWLDMLRARVNAGEIESVLAFEIGTCGVTPQYVGLEQPAKLIHSIGLGVMQGACDAIMGDGGGEELIRIDSVRPGERN